MKVYYFTATWCQPCKRFGPIMDSVKETLSKVVDVIKLDIEEHPELVALYDISSVPTVLIADGQEEVTRFSGAKDEVFVTDYIKHYVT